MHALGTYVNGRLAWPAVLAALGVRPGRPPRCRRRPAARSTGPRACSGSTPRHRRAGGRPWRSSGRSRRSSRRALADVRPGVARRPGPLGPGGADDQGRDPSRRAGRLPDHRATGDERAAGYPWSPPPSLISYRSPQVAGRRQGRPGWSGAVPWIMNGAPTPPTTPRSTSRRAWCANSVAHPDDQRRLVEPQVRTLHGGRSAGAAPVRPGRADRAAGCPWIVAEAGGVPRPAASMPRTRRRPSAC